MIHRFLWLMLIVVFWCTSAFAKDDLTVNGEISSEARFFLFHRHDYIVNQYVNLEGLLEITYEPTSMFTFYTRPRLRIDPLQPERNRYVPYDGYLDFNTRFMDIRAGQVVESWAIVDTYNPTDVLNRRDLEYHLYDPEKMGEIMVRNRYFLPETQWISMPTLAFYFLPVHLETPLPSNDDRFRFSPNAGLGILDTDNSIYPTNYGARLAYAARLSWIIESADFFISYFGGPSREPSFLLNPLTGFLNPTYYRTDLAGGGFQWALDSFLFKSEVAYTWTNQNGLPFYLNSIVPENYFQYVVGLDYQLDSFFQKESITFTVEYAGENDQSTSLDGLRPFKNDLFLAVLIDFNDFASTKLLGSTVVDLNHGETLFEIDLERKIYKELKAHINGFFIIKERDEFTAFNIFPNNSSLALKLSYAF